jgi:HSP20 family molecular chaperone IbpA
MFAAPIGYHNDPYSPSFGLYEGAPFDYHTINERIQTPINLTENGDSYQISAMVPGFKKDQITIDVMGQTMTLKGTEYKLR